MPNDFKTATVDAHKAPIQWLLGPVGLNQVIPTGVWTPVVFGAVGGRPDEIRANDRYIGAETTIHANSNGATLPQGTINVENLERGMWPLPTSQAYQYGYVIHDTGKFQVFRYTGVNRPASGPHQLTGCTLGNVTLATGDVVRWAGVNLFQSESDLANWNLFQQVVGVKWQASDSGTIRCLRAASPFLGGTAEVWYGTDITPNAAAPDGVQRQAMTGQPGGVGTAVNIAQVYHDATGNLELVDGLLDAPIVMCAGLGASY